MSKQIFICADCDKDITNEHDHECKQQRAENRRAQKKDHHSHEIRIAELRAAHRRSYEQGGIE